MMVSFLLWGVVCLVLIMMQNTAAIWLAFILFGLHRGALDTVQKTFVSELVPEAYRASGLGGFQMVIGLVALPSSVIAGLLWDNISVLAPFHFSLLLSAISIILLFFVKERQS
jgi:MFS family permease